MIHSVRPISRVALLFAVAGAAACVEVGTDPEVATSIQIDSLPYPSIVAGDSLRDDDGIVRAIPVQAFNSRNEPLPQVPVTYLVADTGTGLSIDGQGRIFADSTLTSDTLPFGPVRLVAQVGSLQSQARSLYITWRPDSLNRVTAAVDTMLQPSVTVAVFTSDSLAVQLLNVSGTGAVRNVGFWLVHFTLTNARGAPVDTSYARLVAGERLSVVDTTNRSGVAARRVRVNISGYPAGAVSDTLLITASARYRGQPVAGSPVLFTLIVQPSP